MYNRGMFLFSRVSFNQSPESHCRIVNSWRGSSWSAPSYRCTLPLTTFSRSSKIRVRRWDACIYTWALRIHYYFGRYKSGSSSRLLDIKRHCRVIPTYEAELRRHIDSYELRTRAIQANTGSFQSCSEAAIRSRPRSWKLGYCVIIYLPSKRDCFVVLIVIGYGIHDVWEDLPSGPAYLPNGVIRDRRIWEACCW